MKTGGQPAIAPRTDYQRLERTVFTRARMRAFRAAVIGAGALGNAVVEALGLLGAGEVLVADPDTVEASNLTRSTLFRVANTIGRNKAEALAGAAGGLFPDTRFTAAPNEIADLGFGLLDGRNVLFSCVDSEAARLEIAYAAARLGLAVCDGGLGGFDSTRGRVSWFPGGANACYGCTLRDRARERLLAGLDGAPRGCSDPPGTEGGAPRPSTPTLAAIVGSLQVETALRHLAGGQDGAAETVAIELTPAPRLERFAIRRAGACPFHGIAPPVRTAAPQDDAPFDRLFAASETAPPRSIVLDWPVCLEARCRACGLDWPPRRRVAWLRRHGVCPRCGSGDLDERTVVREIREGAPWAALRPAELGLPERHLYTVVTSDRKLP